MDFEGAKNTYKKNAFVQEHMAKKLISLLIKKCGNNFQKIFEIGSGTGFLTSEIKNNLTYQSLILNDLTDNFTGIIPDYYIKGDIVESKVPDNCNLIISNAVFQWIVDYKALFQKLHGAISKDGILAFTCFGEKNYVQIKDITGVGLDYPDLSQIILEAGFETVYFEQALETLYFSDIKDILKHIKYTGVKTKDKFWTKSDFMIFRKKYLEKYNDKLGYELTYHPLYYILKPI